VSYSPNLKSMLHQALELFARAVGTEPSYDTWLAKRLAFINAYVRTKPTAKGNSADQAFSRFAKRLIEALVSPHPRRQAKPRSPSEPTAPRRKKSC
jgi:hypothetical protein